MSMSLNDLDLAALNKLGETLAILMDAGRVLGNRGLDPHFKLTPGEQAVITVAFVMPGLDRIVEDEMPDSLQRQVLGAEPFEVINVPDVYRPNTCSTEAASSVPDAEADPEQPAPVESPAVEQPGLPAGDPIPSAEQNVEDVSSGPVPQVAALSEGVAESGGGQGMAAPAPPAAPAPGSASAMAANWQAPLWTPEEDDRLVDLIARRVVGGGLSRNQAMIYSARDLGRAEEGVKFRCKTKLKARIEAAIDAAGKVLAHDLAEAEAAFEDSADPAPIPASPAMAAATDPAQVSGGDTAVGGHSPAAVQSADPLTAHLRGMTDKGGWSLQRDLELMELSCEGWKPNEIALQLTMQANAIQPRFDALTGLHTDDATGKKQRRWTREEVLGALLVMAGKAAA
jgi:hypothetical protein